MDYKEILQQCINQISNMSQDEYEKSKVERGVGKDFFNCSYKKSTTYEIDNNIAEVNKNKDNIVQHSSNQNSNNMDEFTNAA